jgi:hypothetical protein
VYEKLDIFLARFGIPEALISDGAKTHTLDRFRQKARDAGYFCKSTDPYRPWQDCAEGKSKRSKVSRMIDDQVT